MAHLQEKFAKINGAACSFWDKNAQNLILLGCLLVPLKLSLTYFLFGPVIILWLLANSSKLASKFSEYSWFTKSWYAFVAAIIISSAFGILPSRSIGSLHSLIFYPIIIFAIADKFNSKKSILPLSALILGQSIAGIHSIVEASSKDKLYRLFLGEVTEAGQLALTIPLACGLAISLHRYTGIKFDRYLLVKNTLKVTFAILGLSVLPIFLTTSNLSPALSISIMLALLLILIGLSHYNASKFNFNSANWDFPYWANYCFKNLRILIIPVLIAAVVLNLKRGPWAGVTIALLMLMFIYSRKILLILICGAIGLAFLSPVQQRLYESSKDFFISGGRADMWQVGLEIAERFPLGIGYKNSRELHQYSAEIPKELNHFHNNLINILVEGGPLSLVLFTLWLWSILKFCSQTTGNHKLNPILKASACAITAWFVVGLFEYNLGDSEVMFVLYIILGSVAAAKKLVP